MKITFPLLLGLVFVTLKLCHEIDWTWWWVLIPFWLPLCIAGVIYTVVGILIFIRYMIETPEQRSARKLSESLQRMADAVGGRKS